MRETLEIVLTETPYGDYVAQCGTISAEGSTPEEAEQLLREMLRTRWESKAVVTKETEVLDPDSIPGEVD